MKIDVIVAEIGSTTTIVNAFDKLDSNNPIFIGQGFATTTTDDVTVGLSNAIDDLKKNLNIKTLEAKETFASSSSAGGLKMTVHGLVYDMTAKAAKEAALGAGANIKMITSGVLSKFDLEEIKKIKPNIIMVAGGVNYGEVATALENSKQIASLQLNTPVIYAGNIQIQSEIKDIFKNFNQENYLYITNNVYPEIDVLDVDEARKVIQDVFEEHITKAKGMEKVRSIVNQNIIPTPGAVMSATVLLQEHLGNILTLDIGGATTDIHSATSDSIEVSRKLLSPEPFIKRTVEGDLGVYVNKDNLINLYSKDKLIRDLNINSDNLEELINNYEEIPKNKQISLVEALSTLALTISIKRHAGKYIYKFLPSGKSKLPEGKDLTEVEYIIATGGALTKLANRESIIKNALAKLDDSILKPKAETKILFDNYYIMGTLGVLSKKYPDAALLLLKQSLKIGD